MLNICVLAGNLGENPSSHFSSEGTEVVSFSFAFAHNRKKAPSWIRVVAFGKLAEIASTYLSKGDRVAICGFLEQTKWRSESGDVKTNYLGEGVRSIFLTWDS